jgi:hypothetical protein
MGENVIVNIQEPSFYLASYDCTTYFEPRLCFIKESVKVNDISGCMRCKVEPSITWPKIVNNLDTVIFVPRFVGSTLFPINEWPIHVHVYEALEKNFGEKNCFDVKDLRRIMWGTLHKTYQEALAAIAE